MVIKPSVLIGASSAKVKEFTGPIWMRISAWKVFWLAGDPVSRSRPYVVGLKPEGLANYAMEPTGAGPGAGAPRLIASVSQLNLSTSWV